MIWLLAACAVAVLAVGPAMAAWGGPAGAVLAVFLLLGTGVAGRIWRGRGARPAVPSRPPATRGPAPVARPAPDGPTAILAPLQALSPAEFEEFTRLLFAASGLYHDVRRVGRSGDGGVDLTMRDGAGNLCVVQCKRYRGTVPAGQIRDLAGVMMLQRPREAFFVTTGQVSAGAQAVLGDHLIHVWDGTRLVAYAQQYLGARVGETIERARH